MTMREKMRRAMEAVNQRVFYDEEVDAALDALMEPTPDMAEAAFATADAIVPKDEIVSGFKAMIRAAKEGK